MAKKKSKSKLSAIVAGIIAIVFIVGFVFLIGEVFVSPAPDKLSEAINNTENVAASDAADIAFIVLRPLAGSTSPTDMVGILDSSDGIMNSKVGVVFYYDSMSEAIEAKKSIKENLGDGDYSIRVRGKAVFVGDKECMSLYNKVVF